MHFNLATAMIVTALVAAIFLFTQKTEKVFPLIGVIAAGVMALMAFGVMSLSLTKFRIDVILPAMLLVSGAMCWGKSESKGTVTAATVMTLIGALELISALRLL